MSETAEENERQIVAECMHHLPDKMHKDDGEVLLTILYKIGVLTKYYDAAVRRAEEDREYYYYQIEFSDYFDFEGDAEIDSQGRITFLHFWRSVTSYNGGNVTSYNLPPIIERLQKLQRIHLWDCQLLPIELGNLPLLKSITFDCCDPTLFESIPDGMVLSALIQVKLSGIDESCTSLPAFWKILPDTLEELLFDKATREESDEILCALQNHDDFGFRDSLTKIEIASCQLNEGDLERLLFDILPRFANLHTLNVGSNNIESLRVIEDRIKKLEPISSSSSSSSPPLQTVIPDNKLRKLILKNNPVATKLSNNSREKATLDPKEEAALITILDAFDGIYYFAGESLFWLHPSDVEYLLRINHAGRKFIIKEGAKVVPGSNNKPVVKLALWPKILENAHSKSPAIYDDRFCNEEAKTRNKCSTGLFHLVRHFCGPLLAENRRRRSCNNRETLAASASTTATRIGIRNNDALNRKRKFS